MLVMTAIVCRCDEPGADPYECEADDCSGYFSELNPFGGSRPVNEPSAEVSRTCSCGWRTSVWHVDDGSAEEELHRHTVRFHGDPAASRRISDLDVPRTVLEQQIRDLVARQRAQGDGLADRSSQRLQAVLAPTTQPDTTPEEAL